MDQIEDYTRAVVNDARFDTQAVRWDFVLVATELSDLAQGRVRSDPPGLLFDPEAGVRVWLRTWSEIIGESKHRLRFIREQLEYDPDADQAVAYLRETYPDYVPDHLAAAVDSDNDAEPPTL